MNNSVLWSITLTSDDVNRFQFIHMLNRVDELDNEAVWLKVTTWGDRHWIGTSHNVTSWGTVSSDDRRQSGFVTPMPPIFLHSISNLISDHGECSLSLESDGSDGDRVLIARAGHTSVVADCPTLTQPSFDISPRGSLSFQLTTDDLQQLSTVLASWPMFLNAGEHPHFRPPHAHMCITRTSLTCTLNWRRYGGSATTVSVPVHANGEAFVSFESPILGRAMSMLFDAGDFRLTLDPNNLSVFFVHNSEWGFAVSVRNEAVARWGQRVSDAFAAAGATVADEWVVGEVPALAGTTSQGHSIAATLFSNTLIGADTARVSYRLSENPPTNAEFLMEMALFNERMVGAKTLLHEGQLFIAADVPLTHPDMSSDIGDAVRRVVRYGDMFMPALMVHAFN
jgi:hypothetical protein